MAIFEPSVKPVGYWFVIVKVKGHWRTPFQVAQVPWKALQHEPAMNQ
jgi:hypothetical protein